MSLEVSWGGSSCAGSVCEGYPATPTGSEVDLLEHYEQVTQWLYIGNCTGHSGKWRTRYWRQKYDSGAGAGEYYRDNVQKQPMRELVIMRYGAFLAGQAEREHYEKKAKGKRNHGA